MPTTYVYDPETFKFLYEMPKAYDPVASEKAGEDVWRSPEFATDLAPLDPNEGYDVVFNPTQGIWEYKEIEKPAEPEPYVPTELDKAYDAMYEAKLYLSNTDYINDKINDAVNTGDEELAAELRTKYADTFAERARVRAEVRHWESEIERLTAEKSAE